MLSSAAEDLVKREATTFATVWILAYEEARNLAMAKGLPQTLVLHCAEMVADDVFNRYMRRLHEDETSILS